MPFRLLAALSALALLPVAACSDPSPAEEPTTVTYYQDIKPILDAKCVACHAPGEVGPFSLTDYASASANAAASAAAVAQHVMPPWPPNADCRDYEGDRSLDDAQIAALARWVEFGVPEGDPAAPGAPLDVSIPTLSRVDQRLEMPQAYTPSPLAGSHDDYRCFVVPWPAEHAHRTYVTGFRAVPGNTAIVHHVIAFLAAPNEVAQIQALDAADDGPGYTCFGGAGAPVSGMIGGWAPGSLGSDLPPGVGLPVEPGSAIVLQVHYHGHAGAGNDRSAIELKLDSTVERPGRVVPFANPQWLQGNMPIPAGNPDVVHSFTVDPTPFFGELEIYSASLHMHTLGTSGKLAIQRPDGSRSCLLQIDAWDFSWQGSYGFQQSEILRRGDRLSIECRWDNSMENQPTVGGKPRPPVNVNWGEGTDDEMCVGFFLTAAPR